MARRSTFGLFLFALLVTAITPSTTSASPIFSENFSTSIQESGVWTILNRSSAGGESTWQTGHIDSVLKSKTGGKDTAAVNYFSAGPDANSTASNWLISPVLPFENGQRLSFDVMCQPNNGGFPDRMQVRLNTTNTGTNVGTTETSVGDFTALLLDINPNYAYPPELGAFPTTWTTYSLELDGLPSATFGRFAFRYFVEDSGPNGSRGSEIVLDNVRLDSVPEPAALVFTPLAALLLRRRKHLGS